MPDPLVIAVSAWLASAYAMPVSEDLPTVRFSSSRDLAALRYDGDPFKMPVSSDLVAVYDDRKRTIVLSMDWQGRTPAELSILVHELVHHAQNVAGARFACPAEREKAAFEAQESWLHLFGTSLEEAFDIDPFTLLARTTCAP